MLHLKDAHAYCKEHDENCHLELILSGIKRMCVVQ